MALNTLRDLLLEETNRLYDGIEQVVHTLPSVVNVATERRLRDTLETYLGDKRRQRRNDIGSLNGSDGARAGCIKHQADCISTLSNSNQRIFYSGNPANFHSCTHK